jgi:hypothetical protein
MGKKFQTQSGISVAQTETSSGLNVSYHMAPKNLALDCTRQNLCWNRIEAVRTSA